MVVVGESSSSSTPKAIDEKPVIVRVKRKVGHSPLDAFWLEINERPVKRPLLDFGKLSISDSDNKEDLKPKKVLVQHVETVTSSEDNVGIVQSVLDSVSSEPADGKSNSNEHRQSVTQNNRREKLLSKAVQQQQTAARNARFEQIWRSRRGNKDGECERALHDMCHFYDILRVDDAERSTNAPPKEDTSVLDQRMLASYLPLLREFVPTAAEVIESDINSFMSKQTDEYIYDYYVVKDGTDVDLLHPCPLIQVEDEDFYDGPDDSEYDSEDSNAEDNPKNDYPDEMSGTEDDDEVEEEEEEDEVSKASDASDESEETSSEGYERPENYKYNEDGDFDNYVEEVYDLEDSDVESERDTVDEDPRWSYR